MGDSWVIDSSPLIVLGKAGCLHILESLAASLSVPRSVAEEISDGPGNDPARRWLENDGAAYIAPNDPVPPGVAALNLRAGESAVLACALKLSSREAIIDDFAARRAAAALGIRCRGTLAVILTAKQRGIISAAAPLFDRVQQAGLFVSASLRHQALALVDE